jgi:hypothetical protein
MLFPGGRIVVIGWKQLIVLVNVRLDQAGAAVGHRLVLQGTTLLKHHLFFRRRKIPVIISPKARLEGFGALCFFLFLLLADVTTRPASAGFEAPLARLGIDGMRRAPDCFHS